MSMSVCLSDHMHAQEPHAKLLKFFVHVIHCSGSVLLWQHCDTLCIVRFVDNIVFSQAQQLKCNLKVTDQGQQRTSGRV